MIAGNNLESSSHFDKLTQDKIGSLETTIAEYRAKLNQLDQFLKEEDDIKDDPDKKEEIERLRDQLKGHMII